MHGLFGRGDWFAVWKPMHSARGAKFPLVDLILQVNEFSSLMNSHAKRIIKKWRFITQI
jgi:hypothetical protein